MASRGDADPPPRASCAPRRSCRTACSANPKVTMVWHSVVDEIARAGPAARGHRRSRLRDVRRGALRELPVEGVFVAIGHDPATALVKGQLAMDADGYVITAADSTRDQRAGRVRRRRRAGQDLPPGGDRGRQRLHGRARGREVPGRASRPSGRPSASARRRRAEGRADDGLGPRARVPRRRGGRQLHARGRVAWASASRRSAARSARSRRICARPCSTVTPAAWC